MSELDRKISESLVGIQAGTAPSDMKSVMETVRLEQRRVRRKMMWWSVAWHAFFFAALLIGAAMIFWNDRVNDIAAGLFVCMAALAGLVVTKLAYFGVQIRMRIELQLKQLDLALAELKENIGQLNRR